MTASPSFSLGDPLHPAPRPRPRTGPRLHGVVLMAVLASLLGVAGSKTLAGPVPLESPSPSGTEIHGMLKAGVYLAPSAFEAGFVSATHDRAVLEQTLSTAGEVLAQL